MRTIKIKTNRSKEVIDLTDQINEVINVKTGLCFVFVKHTTTAVTTADLDPGTDLDMLDAFEKIIPKLNYRHPHDPSHVPDHILSTLIGTSVTIPIEDSQLVLGTWQRVVLFEFNGPKVREIVITTL